MLSASFWGFPIYCTPFPACRRTPILSYAESLPICIADAGNRRGEWQSDRERLSMRKYIMGFHVLLVLHKNTEWETREAFI